MNLDEGQKKQIASWVEQGLKLSELQRKLADELKVNITYMELRFLVDDLRLQLKEPARPAAPLPPVAPPAPVEPAPPAAPEAPLPAGVGDVSVTVDQLTRPGALVSGNVTFSDGQTAHWYLDQSGRLGVAPKQAGYKPSQADVMIFQTELQQQLAKLGF